MIQSLQAEKNLKKQQISWVSKVAQYCPMSLDDAMKALHFLNYVVLTCWGNHRLAKSLHFTLEVYRSFYF
jgi:hypothetical protein